LICAYVTIVIVAMTTPTTSVNLRRIDSALFRRDHVGARWRESAAATPRRAHVIRRELNS
jgi:hypothetical protein